MAYNFDKISQKRTLGFFLILSILSVNLLPIFSNKAEAQIPVTDVALIAITSAVATKDITKKGLDSFAMIAARLAIQQVVNSSVRWAQSGFDGNPAYVTDKKQYFTDLADGIAGDYIANNSKLNFLCSPFQVQVRLALKESYVQDHNFQCTLTDAVANIDAFYGDFNQGGWDAWFSMTQNSSNNPYGAYLDAKIDLDSRVASAVGLKKEQLDWDSGFLSQEKCPPGSEPPTGGDVCLFGAKKVIVTPGSIIKGQLDKVLPSGMESLITVNQVEQLIEAFATGLLKKYVFGPEGLFNRGTPSLPVDQPGSSTGGGGNGGGTITPPTYDQCVASCNAAVEQGIDAESCIAISCSPLAPTQ